MSLLLWTGPNNPSTGKSRLWTTCRASWNAASAPAPQANLPGAQPPPHPRVQNADYRGMSAAPRLPYSVGVLSTANPPASAGPGLSPQQLQELAAANRQLRKITSAARMAAFNGYSAALFAVLSLPFVFGSWPTAFICAGLAAFAYRELTGRTALLRLEPPALTSLARNQFLLMGVLVVYGAWQLIAAQVSPAQFPAALSDPQIREMLQESGIEELYSLATLALYGCLIVGAIVFQGLTARYYFRRARLLAEYLANTPQWVRQVQRDLPVA